MTIPSISNAANSKFDAINLLSKSNWAALSTGNSTAQSGNPQTASAAAIQRKQKPSQNLSQRQSAVAAKPVITQSMIGQGHTEQSLRNVDLKKIDLFVMDDFANQNISVGRFGSTTINTSHGEIVTRLASLNLKDKVAVGRLNIGVPGTSGTTDAAAASKIYEVIDMVAKRQGKTRNSPDLDLASVTINWSQGSKYEYNAAPSDELQSATKLLTSSGGTLVTTAGNDWYNGNAAYLFGATVVDGSAQNIGSKASANPLPWADYDNAGMGPYCTDLSRCDGIEARGARPTNNAAAVLVAPSVATFQADASGNVKVRTVDSATGQVTFVPFLARNQTTQTQGKPSSADGLTGQIPSRVVTGEDAKQFLQWINATALQIMGLTANSAKKQTATPQQQKTLVGMIDAESLKRFGAVPVMTLDAVKTLIDAPSGSRQSAVFDGIVPEGLKAKDVLLSVNQVVVEGRRPLGSAQLFKLDDAGKLAPVLLTTIASFGTSWGAPIAAGDIAVAKAALR